MSRTKLIDLYINGVLSGTHNSSQKNLSSVYKNMYVEDTQEQLPGIDGGEQDDMMAIFYVDKSMLTEELVAQFRALGGEGPVHIPTSYFCKVERRFRGKGIESLAREWLSISSESVDEVTYESLLNKLFSSDIRGSEDLEEFKQYVEWQKGNNEEIVDIIHQELSEEQAKTINFVQSLSPVVSYFISSEPAEFITNLWNITEQSNRVGIGKGEMALALLSRGYKGSPGDVKFNQNDNGIQLDIEVKGLKGRPGKDNYAHGVGRNLQNLIEGGVNLSENSVEEIQAVIYPSTLKTRLDQIKQYFNNTFREKPHVKAAIMNDPQGDVIDKFLEEIEMFVYHTKSTNQKDIAEELKKYLEKLQNWSIQAYQQHYPDKTPTHFIAAIDITRVISTGKAGIAWYAASRNTLRSASFIKELTNWREIVMSFFTNVARDMDFDEDMLSRALVEVRSDTLSPGKEPGLPTADDLQQAIKNLLLTEGREVVFDGEALPKLVAAIQFTGYCVADGFNRALFINDRTLTGRSIPTDRMNVTQTLSTIYNEFIQEDYNIDMSIDSANKGVQISYNG